MNQVTPHTKALGPETLQFHVEGLEPSALLSVKDTAKLLNHSTDWIYRRIYQGLLRTQVISGRHVISGADLVAYIDSQVPYGPVLVGCDANSDQKGGQ